METKPNTSVEMVIKAVINGWVVTRVAPQSDQPVPYKVVSEEVFTSWGGVISCLRTNLTVTGVYA